MTLNNLITFAQWAKEGRLQVQLPSGSWVRDDGKNLSAVLNADHYRRAPEPRTRPRRIDEIRCGDTLKVDGWTRLITVVNPFSFGFVAGSSTYSVEDSVLEQPGAEISHDFGKTWEPWLVTEVE